jgi:hypothetical protein
MKKLLLLISVIFYFGVKAQITFDKKFANVPGNEVQQTKDKGYIITGTTNTPDVFLIKTNSTGDTLWTKTYGGLIDDGGASIQQTKDGGYIIGGATNSFGAGSDDGYIIKTDSLGNLLWSETIGGTGQDYIESIRQTKDGGYIVLAYTWSFGVAGDEYIIKTDSVGAILWTKILNGTNNQNTDQVQQTTDGGFIISGVTTSVFLMKVDSIGNSLWVKTYQDSANHYSISGGAIIPTSDGGYMVSGYLNMYSNAKIALFFKTNSNGDVLWAKNFSHANGGIPVVNSINYIQQTQDKGYVFFNPQTIEYGFNGNTHYNSSCFFIKVDSVGNEVWSLPLCGGKIKETSDSGFVFCQNTSLVKIGKNGQLCTTNSNFYGNSTSTIIVAHDTSLVFFSASIVTNAPTLVGHFAGLSDSIICSSVTDIKSYTANNNISIYPNPVTNSLQVRGIINQVTEVQITDVLGNTLFKNEELKMQNGVLQIDVSHLATGVYFIKTNQGTQKFIKQ